MTTPPEHDVVHDGVEEMPTVPRPISRPCPTCGRPCRFEPADVVRRGIDAGWAVSDDVAILQGRLLQSWSFAVGEFDGRRTLRSSDGSSPHVDAVTCDGCGARLLVVVSFGEVQPARWRMVVLGLVPDRPA